MAKLFKLLKDSFAIASQLLSSSARQTPEKKEIL